MSEFQYPVRHWYVVFMAGDGNGLFKYGSRCVQTITPDFMIGQVSREIQKECRLNFPPVLISFTEINFAQALELAKFARGVISEAKDRSAANVLPLNPDSTEH